MEAMFNSSLGPRSRTVFAGVVFCTILALPVLAVAQAPHGGDQGHGQQAGSAAAAAGMGSKEMMAMMEQGHQHMMSMPMTGKPDIDFAMMMRMHHLAGIRMAEAELRDGKEAKTRDMARKIIASQKKEIREFENFLAKHGHPVEKGK